MTLHPVLLNQWARPARGPVAVPGGRRDDKSGDSSVRLEYERRHLVVTERDLFFDARLFEHPYVAALQSRLARGSIRSMLAADTKYVDGDRRLAGTIVAAVPAATVDNPSQVAVPQASRPLLAAPVRVTTIEAVPKQVDLAAGLRLRLDADVVVTIERETKVVLNSSLEVEDVEDTPLTVAVPPGELARVVGDTLCRTAGAVTVVLFDQTKATLPAGTAVALVDELTVRFDTPRNFNVVSSHRIPALHQEFFEKDYGPGQGVRRPYPARDLDFSTSGPYAQYNWELFYHVPLTVALHLSRNGRYAEAQQWLHFLFDPTDDSDEPTPDRFWKVKPFHTTKVRKVDELLVNLSTGVDRRLQADTVAAIEAWRANPFRPHLVARFRPDAYMYRVVGAYLDNLIAWGDSLFAQDTGEAVDEALSLYMLAAQVLGPRPQRVPQKGSTRRQTYAQLRADLDQFGSALRRLEPDLPFNVLPFPATHTGDEGAGVVLRGVGSTLYFCVPHSEKLLRYWSTVEDRLFKIRNSMNLQGVFRQLALFQPPIDPAVLARAAASGANVSAVLAGQNQPPPLVRFPLLLQKANELCSDVKALGAALLSAIEKEDGEKLAVLRAQHERSTLARSEQIAFSRMQEAVKARESAQAGLNATLERFVLLGRQLGEDEQQIRAGLPQLDDLDLAALRAMDVDLTEPELKAPHVELDIAPAIDRPRGKIISSFEAQEIKRSSEARVGQAIAKGLTISSQMLEFIPDVKIDLQWWGLGTDLLVVSGSKIATGVRSAADLVNWAADWLNWEASQAGRIGGYARRQTELEMQRAATALDIGRILKDVRAAQLREAIATLELDNIRSQIRHSAEIQFFLTGEKGDSWPDGAAAKLKKVTNQGFYAWSRREARGLYTQCYQLALDVARKAERAMQHELGDFERTYITGNYMAGNEGLYAGEWLQLDLRRMDAAYQELNRRELELSRRVSLEQINPQALIELRRTGACSFDIPESLYDFGGAGHYFRRIKTVALSIPAVTNDTNGINANLTLVGSKIRRSADAAGAGDPYAAVDGDGRFMDVAGVETIATSVPLNDSGLFEPNLRDDRLLPFERAGAISRWRLTLGGNPEAGHPLQFDYSTIMDVVLIVRYTARDGGEVFRSQCLNQLRAAMRDPASGVSHRLFSLRYDFPAVWAAMPKDGAECVFSFTPANSHFPFFAQPDLVGDDGAAVKVSGVAVLRASPGGPLSKADLDVTPDDEQAPDVEYRFRFDKGADDEVVDAWVVFDWSTDGN